MFEGLLQPTLLLVILGIAILVFGPKRIPELGKGLGEGIRGFKSAIQQHDHAAVSPKADDSREIAGTASARQ